MDAGKGLANGPPDASPLGRRSGAQRGMTENTSARGLSPCPIAFTSLSDDSHPASFPDGSPPIIFIIDWQENGAGCKTPLHGPLPPFLQQIHEGESRIAFKKSCLVPAFGH
jgi:hypothetical protein